MTKRQRILRRNRQRRRQTSPGAQFDRVKLTSQAWVADHGSDWAHERAQLVQILDFLRG